MHGYNCSTQTSGDSKPKRVLSIQSHVVHGYVGNKCATFPLQVLGFDVDAINSVHFSNHTGYEHLKGQKLSDKELSDVFLGLQLNNLLGTYTHLLTGYIGVDSSLTEIATIVKSIREVNPDIVYVCDPVLGDDGQLYVPESLIPIYQEKIIPLADICTPNQFEAELLTGIKIKTQEDAWQAIEWFHQKGVKIVALSSTNISDENELIGFLSRNDVLSRTRHKIKIPVIGYGIVYTGVGDLFAALFLAHSTTQATPTEGLEYTIATIQAVLHKTLDYVNLHRSETPNAYQRELRLIQSKNAIENPVITIRAEMVD